MAITIDLNNFVNTFERSLTLDPTQDTITNKPTEVTSVFSFICQRVYNYGIFQQTIIDSSNGSVFTRTYTIDTETFSSWVSNPAQVANNLVGGWANYINGDVTPIAFVAATPTKMTLDATTGSGVIEDGYLPAGVTGLWNSATSQFNFSTLNVGDMIDIRIDGVITTTGANTSYNMSFKGAIGTANEFTLPMINLSRFAAGDTTISRYNGLFIGSEEMRDNPAELISTMSEAGSGYLIDIYIKVINVNS